MNAAGRSDRPGNRDSVRTAAACRPAARVPSFLALLCAVVLAAVARGEGRVTVLHPVAGGEMMVLVDRIEAGSDVVLLIDGTALDRKRADPSGCARFRLPVDPRLVDRTVRFSALVDGRALPEGRVRFTPPQLFVVGETEEGALLWRIAWATDGASAPVLVSRLALGRGEPGPVLRDDRSRATFVVADRPSGRCLLVPDDPSLPPVELHLPPGVRDAVGLAGGRWFAVSSAGGTDGGLVTIVDAHAERVESQIALDPFGREGGALVAAPDGRLFVVVDRLFVRAVEPASGRLGPLLRVGDASEGRVVGLSAAADRLLAAVEARRGGIGVALLSTGDLSTLGTFGPADGAPPLAIGPSVAAWLAPERSAVLRWDVDARRPRAPLVLPAGAVRLVPAGGPTASAAVVLRRSARETRLLALDLASGTRAGEVRLEGADVDVVTVDVELPEGLAPSPGPAQSPVLVRHGGGLFLLDAADGRTLALPAGGLDAVVSARLER